MKDNHDPFFLINDEEREEWAGSRVCNMGDVIPSMPGTQG